MKRILINATHNEEIRVALCKDNHLYDFDLENRTREQKKANIYKGHVTRVEPSLEAVFVEYGSARQGFLPLREIAPEYFRGNPKEDGIKQLIREGDELIVQVEKEERGNKGAALSTHISLAGRYLVLMPNNAKGGGISRQISGKVREEMRQIISSLSVPKNMSIIVRTAGIGRGFEDLQNDLNHLLDTWADILKQSKAKPSPCLMHQEAGVVTRAVRDHLRDDISEVWIDSENAYNEAANFIAAVMPTQMNKLRKYTEYEPLFARFGIERQIETAYQREVRLPSGGSIVIDQTEALVSIDINSAKSTKGSDVAETAYHTNLEAADEIARQLRLRDMGGLIVIDFIDMGETQHQKDVEKRLIDATRYDRARVQFAEISKFGLMEMSRQRLRPSLEEATGYLCPRCHGNGMIRDLRSLSLSIMRQIEQIALKERMGEIQAEVPTEIAAFLLNEKRESLVYLEQDSGTRITILPHAHLESPNFSLHFNPDGFAPASYERIVDSEEQLNIDRGYDTNWHTEEAPKTGKHNHANHWQDSPSPKNGQDNRNTQNSGQKNGQKPTQKPQNEPTTKQQPQAVAWLANLFAPKPSASVAGSLTSSDAAAAIEAIVNGGSTSLGVAGSITAPAPEKTEPRQRREDRSKQRDSYKERRKAQQTAQDGDRPQKDKPAFDKSNERTADKSNDRSTDRQEKYQKRDQGSRRDARGEVERGETLTPKKVDNTRPTDKPQKAHDNQQSSGDTDKPVKSNGNANKARTDKKTGKGELDITVTQISAAEQPATTVHLSIDNSKPVVQKSADTTADKAVRTDNIGEQKTGLENGVNPKAQPNEANHEASIETNNETSNTAIQPSQNGEATEVSKVNASDKQADTKAGEPNLTVSGVDSTTSTQTTASKADDDQGQKDEASAIKAPAVIRPTLPTRRTPANSTNVIDGELASRVATRMRLIKNDPRVVQMALSETTTVATSTPTGLAGAFIRKHIANADARLAEGEFVACFIEAVNQANTTAPVASFDFANYGYGVLNADYLDAFRTLTTAIAQFDAPQGKTAVAPRPIGKRAENDPRGQHPDYLNSMGIGAVHGSETGANEAQANEAQMSETEASDTKSGDTLPATLTIDNSVDTDVMPLPDPIGDTTDAISQNAKDVIQQLADTISELIDANDNTDKADKSGETAEQSTKNANDDESSSNEETSTEANSQGKKTTISSYKNMIESVAGQLLPQTGILSLAVPKPAKAPAKPKATRSKKARTAGSNKPKAEVVRKPKADTTVDVPTAADDGNAGE